MLDISREYMLRAIDLGNQVRYKTGDNPWVGCVIVKGSKIVGEGFTHQEGGPHAEAHAIRNAEINGNSVSGSTLYCTLEPCSFHGRTPSCAKVIINKNIYHVVIAIRDPHPRVNGEGIRILKAGGIRITEGVEEYAVRRSLEDWLKKYQ